MIFLGENQGSVFPNPSMRTVRADYAHWASGLCALSIRTMRTERPDRPHSCSKGFVQKKNIKVSPAPAVSLNKCFLFIINYGAILLWKNTEKPHSYFV